VVLCLLFLLFISHNLIPIDVTWADIHTSSFGETIPDIQWKTLDGVIAAYERIGVTHISYVISQTPEFLQMKGWKDKMVY
jgi:hypothetical protein